MGQFLVRRPHRRCSPTLEGLEARPLLSVSSAMDSSGLLLVTADADDSIAVQSVSGALKINGADPDTGPFPSAGVTAVEIACTATSGPDSNVIDLSQVTPSRFAFLTSVS